MATASGRVERRCSHQAGVDGVMDSAWVGPILNGASIPIYAAVQLALEVDSIRDLSEAEIRNAALKDVISRSNLTVQKGC